MLHYVEYCIRLKEYLQAKYKSSPCINVLQKKLKDENWWIKYMTTYNEQVCLKST